MFFLFMLEWKQNGVINQQRKQLLFFSLFFFLCGVGFDLVGKDFVTVHFSFLYEFTLLTFWVCYIISFCWGSSIVECINGQ